MGVDYFRKIHPRNWSFFGVLFVMEIAIFILFGVFVNFQPYTTLGVNGQPKRMDNYYKFYMDITTMVFVGTGFLYSFMKKYSYSGIGLTYLIASFVIQWEILVEGFFVFLKGTETTNFGGNMQYISLSIPNIINANFGALAVLISFGAVLGKANPLQLLLMAIVETVFYCLNLYVGSLTLLASDVGGAMFIHLFGGLFGLACSYTMGHQFQINQKAKKKNF